MTLLTKEGYSTPCSQWLPLRNTDEQYNRGVVQDSIDGARNDICDPLILGCVEVGDNLIKRVKRNYQSFQELFHRNCSGFINALF